MKLVKLSYWESCYFSVYNHLLTMDLDHVRPMAEKHNRRINDYIMRKFNQEYCWNVTGIQYVFHPKFVERYIDQITDEYVIDMILSDVSSPDHLKVYLKMREAL